MTDKLETRNPDLERWMFRAASIVNAMLDGKLNSFGSFTLTAASTTTVVNDPRAGIDSVVLPMPRSATAAAAMTALYVSAKGKGTFTLTHDNTADIDRTFDYVVIG